MPNGRTVLDTSQTSFRGTGDLNHTCQEVDCRGNSTCHILVTFRRVRFFHASSRSKRRATHYARCSGYSPWYTLTPIGTEQNSFSGPNEYGVFQQDFLSASDYENEKCNVDVYDPRCPRMLMKVVTRMQVGPAATQMHTFQSKREVPWSGRNGSKLSKRVASSQ